MCAYMNYICIFIVIYKYNNNKRKYLNNWKSTEIWPIPLVKRKKIIYQRKNRNNGNFWKKVWLKMLVEDVKTFIFWMLGQYCKLNYLFLWESSLFQSFLEIRHGCISSLHLIFWDIQGIFWKKFFSSAVYKSCAW